VGLVGVALFGWSAPILLLLCFVDTLGAMWAVLSAVSYRLGGADRAGSAGDALYGLLSALAVGAVATAFLAVPLGVPLVFVLGTASGPWREAAADGALAAGAGVVLLSAVVSTVRHYQAMLEGRGGEARVKQAFAIVFTRWMLVVLVIYHLAGLVAGPLAAYVLLAVYAAATTWSDLAPERFARLFPDRRPGRAEA
jgi:hypothetical protein